MFVISQKEEVVEHNEVWLKPTPEMDDFVKAINQEEIFRNRIVISFGHEADDFLILVNGTPIGIVYGLNLSIGTTNPFTKLEIRWISPEKYEELGGEDLESYKKSREEIAKIIRNIIPWFNPTFVDG